jgi:hypothetical protein
MTQMEDETDEFGRWFPASGHVSVSSSFLVQVGGSSRMDESPCRVFELPNFTPATSEQLAMLCQSDPLMSTESPNKLPSLSSAPPVCDSISTIAMQLDVSLFPTDFVSFVGLRTAESMMSTRQRALWRRMADEGMLVTTWHVKEPFYVLGTGAASDLLFTNGWVRTDSTSDLHGLFVYCLSTQRLLQHLPLRGLILRMVFDAQCERLWVITQHPTNQYRFSTFALCESVEAARRPTTQPTSPSDDASISTDPSIHSGFGSAFESAFSGPIICRVGECHVGYEISDDSVVWFGPSHFLAIPSIGSRLVCQSLVTSRIAWEMQFTFSFDKVTRTPDCICLAIASPSTVYIVHLSPSMIPVDVGDERAMGTNLSCRPAVVGAPHGASSISAASRSSTSASASSSRPHRVYIFDPPAPLMNPPPILHLYALD